MPVDEEKLRQLQLRIQELRTQADANIRQPILEAVASRWATRLSLLGSLTKGGRQLDQSTQKGRVHQLDASDVYFLNGNDVMENERLAAEMLLENGLSHQSIIDELKRRRGGGPHADVSIQR